MFLNSNLDIRKAKEGIPNWVIAKGLGVSEQTVLRWLRTEMSDDMKSKIMNVIKEVKGWEK